MGTLVGDHVWQDAQGTEVIAPTHWRRRIEQFLVHSKTKLLLNCLLLVDVVLIMLGSNVEIAILTKDNADLRDALCTSNSTELNWSYSEAGQSCSGYWAPKVVGQATALIVISAIEISILTTFLAEHVLMVLAIRKHYFKLLFLVDFFAVLTSLAFEIVIVTTAASLPGAVLTLFRFWRFFRIADHTMANRRVGKVPTERRARQKKNVLDRLALEALRISIAASEAFDFQKTVQRITGSLTSELSLAPTCAPDVVGVQGLGDDNVEVSRCAHVGASASVLCVVQLHNGIRLQLPSLVSFRTCGITSAFYSLVVPCGTMWYPVLYRVFISRTPVLSLYQHDPCSGPFVVPHRMTRCPLYMI
jgi:hypothetical protein